MTASPEARRWNSPTTAAVPFHKPRKLLAGQVDELRARRAAGESERDLALAYGITVKTLRKYLP